MEIFASTTERDVLRNLTSERQSSQKTVSYYVTAVELSFLSPRAEGKEFLAKKPNVQEMCGKQEAKIVVKFHRVVIKV